MQKLIKYLETLVVTQGAGAGDPLHLLPWQKKFIRAAFSTDGNAALSVARGNGKTTLTAGIACATLDGPLTRPRAQTIIVASSFNQARICFDHIAAFMWEKYDLTRHPRNRWRLQDSSGIASITDRTTGAVVRCIGSDPRRAHGIAPALILADEPAQWEHSKAGAMVAALKTSMGKIEGSRMISLGTRPDDTDHWFAKELAGGAAYAQSHETAKGDKPFHKATWRKANPSLPRMPALEKAIRREAKEAKRDPALLAAFRALRLNMGTSDTPRASLLNPDTWQAAEGDAPREGAPIFGVDLGTTGAMSAIAAVWTSGRMEALAAFPSYPDLERREQLDGVPGLYRAVERSGDLVTAPGRVTSPKWLLQAAIRRYGLPQVVVSDRWRVGELEDALAALAPAVPIVPRGQGFKDGADDVRRFRAAILDGTLRPVRSLLLRSAMSEAVVIADPAGNEKLAKASQGGRRFRARDDAAAAAILAAAELMRWQEAPDYGANVVPFQRVAI